MAGNRTREELQAIVKQLRETLERHERLRETDPVVYERIAAKLEPVVWARMNATPWDAPLIRAVMCGREIRPAYAYMVTSAYDCALWRLRVQEEAEKTCTPKHDVELVRICN
jgi:hypothetical protein